MSAYNCPCHPTMRSHQCWKAAMVLYKKLAHLKHPIFLPEDQNSLAFHLGSKLFCQMFFFKLDIKFTSPLM